MNFHYKYELSKVLEIKEKAFDCWDIDDLRKWCKIKGYEITIEKDFLKAYNKPKSELKKDINNIMQELGVRLNDRRR